MHAHRGVTDDEGHIYCTRCGAYRCHWGSWRLRQWRRRLLAWMMPLPF